MLDRFETKTTVYHIIETNDETPTHTDCKISFYTYSFFIATQTLYLKETIQTIFYSFYQYPYPDIKDEEILKDLENVSLHEKNYIISTENKELKEIKNEYISKKINHILYFKHFIEPELFEKAYHPDRLKWIVDHNMEQRWS